MKKVTVFLLCFFILISSISAFSQTRRFKERRVDVRQGLERFRSYFSSRSRSTNFARGSGFKPFKRWEWFMKPRMEADGTVPAAARWNAFQDILAAKGNAPLAVVTANWTSIGPTNIAGRMLDIAFDPNDPNVLWAGAASGGIWKTTDSGLTWQPADDKLPTLAVSAVVTHNTDSNIIYIGTGEGSFNIDAVLGVGVLKSTDGGVTWNTTGLNWDLSSRLAVNEMVMDPTNANVLIAATKDGVYRTADAGITWTQTLNFATGWSDAKDVEIDPVNPNNVYVALGFPWGDDNNGIYKSTDNGVTWSKLTTGLPDTATNVGRTSLTIHAADPSILYAGISGSFAFNGSQLLGVYKTTDGGTTWTQVATSPNFYGSQGWYDNVIAVDPVDPDVVYSGGVSLYKSTDGGVSWTNITNGIHVDQHAFAFEPGAPSTIFAGNDGGMYKSTDGGSTWSDINDGLTTMQFYAMGNDPNDANIAFGGTQDNGTNRYNNSTVWDAVWGGDGGECTVDYTNSSVVYAENQLGSHVKSTDGGTSWFSINSGLLGNGPWVTPVEMDPSVPVILYAISDDNLYRTTSGGNFWTLLFDPTEVLETCIKVAPGDNQTIYVSGFDVLYRSTDNGSNWTDITAGLTPPSITCLAVHPNDAQTLYVTMSGWTDGEHVFKSSDGGTTWQNVTNDLPNIPCNTIVIDPALTDHVYVGTDLGVYVSLDGGISWKAWNDGLPNVVVDELDIQASARLIRAATHGRGMYESPLLEQTVLVVVNEVVANPQSDWNDSSGGNGVGYDNQPGSGTIDADDEWIELFNDQATAVDLTASGGWDLIMTDSAPTTLNFATPDATTQFIFSNGGSLSNFQPGEYLVIGNPPGEMDDNVYVQLQMP